jgi:hypothetical protein
MDLPLMSGTYSVVVWGNSDTDYKVSPVVRGSTDIAEATLSIKSKSENSSVNISTPLFYGSLPNVTIQADTRRSRIYTIDLTKNTKKIDVFVRGLPLENNDVVTFTEKYDIFIHSKSDSLKFADNKIASSTSLNYMPESHFEPDTVGENLVWVSEFVLMRELDDASTGSEIIITQRDDPNGSAHYILKEPLTPMLLQGLGAGEDFETKDHFTIEITFEEGDSEFKATIRINGYDIADVVIGV